MTPFPVTTETMSPAAASIRATPIELCAFAPEWSTAPSVARVTTLQPVTAVPAVNGKILAGAPPSLTKTSVAIFSHLLDNGLY